MNQTSQKKYYTIGEVSEIVKVPAHSLRFWENKFTQIKPKKTRGRRYYSQSDIDIIKHIKYLLYTKRYSIQEISQVLKQNSNKNLGNAPGDDSENFKTREETNNATSSSGSDPRPSNNTDPGRLVQKIELNSKNRQNSSFDSNEHENSAYPSSDDNFLVQQEFRIDENSIDILKQVENLLEKLYSLRAKLA